MTDFQPPVVPGWPTAEEQDAMLTAHLAECRECREAARDYWEERADD